MRKIRVPYLECRSATYYFRFRFPPPTRIVLGRTNIRLSLNTQTLLHARERVAAVLSHAYVLKRLCRKTRKMTPTSFAVL